MGGDSIFEQSFAKMSPFWEFGMSSGNSVDFMASSSEFAA